MSLQVEIQPASSYLYVLCQGDYTFAETMALYQRAIEAGVEYGLPKILIDARKVTGDPTMIERYQFAELLAELQKSLLPNLQIAVVGYEPLIDPGRFGEVVAINRGVWAKATTDIDAAITWLQSAASR